VTSSPGGPGKEAGPGPETGALTVLGVDPGTSATGYGVVRRERGPEGRGARLVLVECGVIRPAARAPLPTRIRHIFEGVSELLDRFAPDVMAVESVFHGKNARSALVLGHARGAILLAAELREITLADYTPVAIKKAVVGHGSATKEQVGRMVQERLRLVEPPRPADAADGVAAALCHLVRGGKGLMVEARRPGPRGMRGVTPGQAGRILPREAR
jgi:crossover junction endodeoxyribonuclease RuvC